MQIEAIAKRLTTTTAPDGRVRGCRRWRSTRPARRMIFRFRRATRALEKILREVGYDVGAIAKLREAHVIAGPDAVVTRS